MLIQHLLRASISVTLLNANHPIKEVLSPPFSQWEHRLGEAYVIYSSTYRSVVAELEQNPS